jgi:hypothetical protein
MQRLLRDRQRAGGGLLFELSGESRALFHFDKNRSENGKLTAYCNYTWLQAGAKIYRDDVVLGSGPIDFLGEA